VGTTSVPWEEWGPRAARVISPSMFQWITAHAGQRWLSLDTDKLVVRDFCAARIRVQHARARARAREARRPDPANDSDGDDDDDDMNHFGAGGARAAAPAAALTLIPGGLACFKEDVVSELPFIETRVDARVRAGDMVLTDGERLVAFIRAVSKLPKPAFSFFKSSTSDSGESVSFFTGPASDVRNSRTAGLRGRS